MPREFVHTGTILDRILDHKVEEIAVRRRTIPQQQLEDTIAWLERPRDMRAALQRDTVALIAEVKHASPSKGVLIEPFDPVALAQAYQDGGAAAISVLTDEAFFQGSLDDLTAVRRVVDIPVLRKDFLVDAYQVYEARAAGADAVLLITAALDDARLADMHVLSGELGLTALVEVHDEGELERALRLAPRLVGVNNRDLRTFEVDLANTARLAPHVPPDVLLVAESGIHTVDDVRAVADAGTNAVLVGEALVRAGAVRDDRVRELSGQPRRRTR